jgi:hypothetical protein
MTALFVLAMIVAGSIVTMGPASAAMCTPRVKIDPAPEVHEGNPLVFTATLVTQPGCPVVGKVNYHTQAPVVGGGFDATPGANAGTPKVDYISTNGVLEWKPGDPATKEIPVQTLVDTLYEVPEEVEVCLDRASDVEIPAPCARAQLSSPMCLSDDMTAPFAIGLSQPARDDVTVVYDTIDGTAKEGDDFVGVHNGRVRIPRGQSDTVAPVRILPNQPGERFEYFFVEFRSTHDGYTERGLVKVDIMTR